MGKEMIGVFLGPDVKSFVAKIATIKGQSVSEYVRNLILADLDNRAVFTSAYKAEIKEAKVVGGFPAKPEEVAPSTHACDKSRRDAPDSSSPLPKDTFRREGGDEGA